MEAAQEEMAEVVRGNNPGASGCAHRYRVIPRQRLVVCRITGDMDNGGGRDNEGDRDNGEIRIVGESGIMVIVG